MNTDAKVYVKKYESSGEVIIAVCDAELIGKTIDDGRIRLYVDPLFYRGVLMTIREAIKVLGDATIANLVGNNIVEAAIEKRLVHPEAVLEIHGIKHAQFATLGSENA